MPVMAVLAVKLSAFRDIILSIGRLECGSHRVVAILVASPVACSRRSQDFYLHNERVQATVN